MLRTWLLSKYSTLLCNPLLVMWRSEARRSLNNLVGRRRMYHLSKLSSPTWKAGAGVKNERAVSSASGSHRFHPEKFVTAENGTIYVCRFQSQFVSNPVYVLVLDCCLRSSVLKRITDHLHIRYSLFET